MAIGPDTTPGDDASKRSIPVPSPVSASSGVGASTARSIRTVATAPWSVAAPVRRSTVYRPGVPPTCIVAIAVPAKADDAGAMSKAMSACASAPRPPMALRTPEFGDCGALLMLPMDASRSAVPSSTYSVVPVVPATDRSYASALTVPALTAVSVAASVPSSLVDAEVEPTGMDDTHPVDAGVEVDRPRATRRQRGRERRRPDLRGGARGRIDRVDAPFGPGDADTDQLSRRRADIEADDPLAGHQTGDGNGGRDRAGGRRVEPDDLAHPGQADQRCGREQRRWREPLDRQRRQQVRESPR